MLESKIKDLDDLIFTAKKKGEEIKNEKIEDKLKIAE